MLILIKGAGDIASGCALRLVTCGLKVVMTDLPCPTAIRRTVAFSEAIIKGETQIEGIKALRANNIKEVHEILKRGCIPVLADEKCSILKELKPDVLVDAIIAKRNTGTSMDDADCVIGIGPGFTADADCHAAVESMRGHTLGRVYYEGSPLPNTAVPGLIGGYAGERVLRAPCSGVFESGLPIGTLVKAGDAAAFVKDESGNKHPVNCTIEGVLRGVLPDGIPVYEGMKAGDVDPRGDVSNCFTVSDKALAIAGGVLEAVLSLTGALV